MKNRNIALLKPSNVIIFTFLFIIISCNNKRSNTFKYYPNGKIKSEIIQLKKNDTLDYKCIDYYTNGKVKMESFLKDSLMSGYCKSFYQNGIVESEGNWIFGHRIGIHDFYDSLGKLEKVIEYIYFKDKFHSKPNELLRFDANGDTLYNQSLFYQYYWKSDTIKDGALYSFKIVLAGHLFNKAYIEFNDYDDKFRLISNKSYGKGPMNDFEIELNLDNYKIGENFIRAKIVNYEQDPQDSSVMLKSAELYLSRKFYVIPR